MGEGRTMNTEQMAIEDAISILVSHRNGWDTWEQDTLNEARKALGRGFDWVQNPNGSWDLVKLKNR